MYCFPLILKSLKYRINETRKADIAISMKVHRVTGRRLTRDDPIMSCYNVITLFSFW